MLEILRLRTIRSRLIAGFGASIGLLVLAGTIAFGVGLLVSIPLAMGALACAYDDLFGEAADEDETDS